MLLKNKKFYAKSIKEYGITPGGVHWKNKKTQYKRFEILTNGIKNDIKSSSVVDAGCGFGEYYIYLQNNDLLPKSYYGIDCEAQMISIAKKRCNTSSFYKRNILKDILFEADYYVASGSLNLLNLEEMEIFIKRSFEHSKKGFVFNCLKGFTFNNIEKAEVISLCNYYADASNVTVIEGYLDNDFTIFMVK